MKTIRFVATMALPMLALACNETPRSAAGPEPQETQNAARDMARIDADVRLDVALKRISALEREVAELKAGPATVETDMLRQQLSATQNALADASRNSVGDDALVQPTDRPSQPTTAKPGGSGAASTSSPQRGRSSAGQTATPVRAGPTPAAQPKVAATDRPRLDLDLR